MSLKDVDIILAFMSGKRIGFAGYKDVLGSGEGFPLPVSYILIIPLVPGGI